MEHTYKEKGAASDVCHVYTFSTFHVSYYVAMHIKENG